MGTSTLDPANFPNGEHRIPTKGHDAGSLGPSDSSDSGSDIAGADPVDDDSDRNGTGERAAVGRKRRTRTDADLDTDQVVTGDSEDPATEERELGDDDVERPR